MEDTLKANTASVTATISLLPVGTIMPFAGDLKDAEELRPQGWLLCDGTAVSKTIFPLLDKLMKNACGSGTQTDFILPDLQGVFLRGFDGIKKRDPDSNLRTPQAEGGNTGNTILTRQEDELKRHKHGIAKKANITQEDIYRHEPHGHFRWEAIQGETEETTGNETRPKNVTVNYIIFAGLPQAA